MNEPISTAAMIFHGVLAVFGAIVHALHSHRKGTTKTFIDFLALTVMSSFSGVMFMLIGLELFPNQLYVTAAITGTGGFLGVEGMAILIERVKTLIK